MTDSMRATFVVATLAACSGDRVARGSEPQSAEPDGLSRSLHVDEGRLGFDHVLRGRASKTSLPYDLRDGDVVTSGYRIHAVVMTSEDAHLYAAFCSSGDLAVYPSRMGVATRAGVLTRLPPGAGEIVIRGSPGLEVLYLILSRGELSIADPRLAAAIAAASSQITDCGSRLDSELSRPPGGGEPTQTSSSTVKAAGTLSPKQVMRGDVTKTRPRPPRAHSQGSASAVSSGKNGAGIVQHGAQAVATPMDAGIVQSDQPDFIRNAGDFVWYEENQPHVPEEVVAADADGIAIVRYEFKHVASTTP